MKEMNAAAPNNILALAVLDIECNLQLRRAERLESPDKVDSSSEYRKCQSCLQQSGWKSTFVVQEICQQADDETLLRVMTEGASLREVG